MKPSYAQCLSKRFTASLGHPSGPCALTHFGSSSLDVFILPHLQVMGSRQTSCYYQLSGRALTAKPAFYTTISTGLLAEQLSFAFPAALLTWRRRGARFLPQNSRYNMGRVGCLVNSMVLVWTCLVFIVYSFPPLRPVSVHNMSELKNAPMTSRIEAPSIHLLILNLHPRLHLCSVVRYGPVSHHKLVLVCKEQLPGTKGHSTGW